MSEVPRRTRKLLVELRREPGNPLTHQILIEATGWGAYEGFGTCFSTAKVDLDSKLPEGFPEMLWDAAHFAWGQLAEDYGE